MSAIQRQVKQQIETIREGFSLHNERPTRQRHAFDDFMSLICQFASIKEVKATPLLFGVSFVQVKLANNRGIPSDRKLTFFVPPEGGEVYRYSDDKVKQTIYLNRDAIAAQKKEAIPALKSSNWLAFSPAPF